MSREKRPALSTIVGRALRAECALAKGTPLVVAVSGGPDSMALLSVLARLGPRTGIEVIAHGVDHGLRASAAAELDIAEAFARDAGVLFDRTCVAVSRGGNLQARARRLRWNALVAVARSRGAAIVTAHHADDRAETLLIRILRGAGLRGLGVLPARATAPEAPDVTVIRPLLRAQRTDVITHLRRHEVPFATDPSNEDPRYLRTRVRSRVMPLLCELDPAVVRHLEALADELVATPQLRTGIGTTGTTGEAAASSWTAALPRPTQEAIAALVRTRSRAARVWLPGGLMVSIAPEAKPSGYPSTKQKNHAEEPNLLPSPRRRRGA